MSPVVVIFGADSVLGRYLTRYFARHGREVVAVARQRRGWNGDGMFLAWDGCRPGPWGLALEGAEAVINLEGWHADGDSDAPPPAAALVDERLAATRVIGAAVAATRVPPRVWINLSSVAWYREDHQSPQDDWTGEPGEGPAGTAARRVEEAFFALQAPAATRKVALRLGSVLVHETGTLWDRAEQAPGLPTPPTGTDWKRVSWLHMEDLLRAMEFIVRDSFLGGTLNLTAPDSPTSRELRQLLARTPDSRPGRPASRPVDDASPVCRWVLPVRLRDAGFCWRWPQPAAAIHDLRQRRGLDAFFEALPARIDPTPSTAGRTALAHSPDSRGQPSLLSR